MDTILVKDGKNRVTVSVAEKGATGPAGPQGQSANLPPANSTTLGGIIVGANLSITGNGVLSVADTFQPKLANTTYGLTDTGIGTLGETSPYEYYVNGEYVNKGLDKYYLGLRGQKDLETGDRYDELYAVGSYRYNANGILTDAASLELEGSRSALVSSSAYGSSYVTAGDASAAMLAVNGTIGSSILLSNAKIIGRAEQAYFELSGRNGGTGSNQENYRLVFGHGSSLSSGITLEHVARKSLFGFVYTYDISGIDYKMTNGLSFDNTAAVISGASTSFRHTNDAIISGVRTGTEIKASINKVELFYLNVTPSYTANSILTQGYADTRYLTSANLTYANITGTPTTLAGYGITDGLTSANLTPYLTISSANSTYSILGHTHSIANVTGLQAALDAKLPSANFTYANITGKPTLANVATSGSYTDLSNTPTAYSLPTATNTTLGGIKVGANLSISNGVLSAVSSGSSATSLPWANITSTPTTLAGYGITDGLTSANAAATYVTSSDANNAFAAKTVAINPGTGLTGGGNLALSRTLSLANTTVTAGSYGSSSLVPVLTVDAQGRLTSVTTAAVSEYTLPAATTSTLGGVRLGAGVNLDANGFLISDVKLTTNSFTGSQNLQDNELIRAKIRDYSETVSSPTISSGTLVLNLETSNIFTVSLNAAITTLTISNPPASGSGGSFTLIFTADGTARAVTWPASIKWAGGTAPTITSASGKVDSFAFFTSDGGTNWQGYVGGQNF